MQLLRTRTNRSRLRRTNRSRLRGIARLSGVLACAGSIGCAMLPGHDGSPTVAEGAGVHITLQQLDDRAKQELFVEHTRGDATRIYHLRSETLDEMIRERVASAEAERRGLSIEALRAAEAAPVTDADVRAFYDANQQRLPEDTPFEQVEVPIRQHLERQNGDRVIASLVEAAAVEVQLEAPRIRVDAFGPSKGPDTAPITIIEFSDFQCPYCRKALPVVQEVLQRYPQQIRLVYRHLPLEAIHPRARAAAEASACAADQGRFWEYHDLLFEPGPLKDENLRAHAEAIGLDLDAWQSCVTQRTHRDTVTADIEAARGAGITGTPAFLVNGVLLTGAKPVEAFERVIDHELDTLAAAP